MGTLVVHILIFSVFLLADVNRKGTPQREEIVIEFPDDIPEPEPEIEEPEEEPEQEQEPVETTDPNNLTNVASNRLATENVTSSTDDFFDQEYLDELEAAKRLSEDVNNQLSKKIVDIKDIKMPVETTEGMERDSIKNVIYVGESNIVYYLDNRYHVSLHNPLYLGQRGGKIIVDIRVDRNGRVIKATPRKNKQVREEQLYLYAEAAAMGTLFNPDESAPAVQKGSIHYTFIAQ